jgi:cystathionine beta-synthase
LLIFAFVIKEIKPRFMEIHTSPYNHIYDLIGQTPIVRLRKLSELTKSDVYAKLECYNPGQSVKDRIVIRMIEAAEADGRLQPGGCVVEATSGNTGFSIAMICAAKGYECVLTVKDTASYDKVQMIEALGAKVVMCDGTLPGDHPECYYNRAKRLAKDHPKGFYLNQNHDLGNARAHYHTTGPEVWEQTNGQITHFIACASTGGTVSGTGRFLKEQNPDVEIIGVDSVTNVLRTFHETGEFQIDRSKKSKLEGVGKNIIPSNVNFDIIDRFVNVADDDSAYAALHLAKEEGIFAGYSSGAALAALEKIALEIPKGSKIVILFPDSGARYLSKIYDKKWMAKQGFLNGKAALSTAK